MSKEPLLLVVPSKDLPNVWDVTLQGLHLFDGFEQLEVHVVVYPYARNIRADDYGLYPYAEYAKDLSDNRKSAYKDISKKSGKQFGLLLGVFISLVFLVLKPTDLQSVESIVSVLGAYFIGKDIWGDLRTILVNWTKGWRFRFVEPYYSYQLEKHTTLQQYSSLARKKRYRTSHIAPMWMDYIELSHSHTVRLCFDEAELRLFDGEPNHLMSLRMKSRKLELMKEKGYLLGLKVSANKRVGLVWSCTEVFQSFDSGQLGCLDEAQVWHNDAVYCRKTSRLGSFKYFHRTFLLADKQMLYVQS